MTLYELLDRTRRYLGREVAEADLINYLNYAQERVSRDLLIPRQFVTTTAATPLQVPSAMWGDMVLSIGWVPNPGQGEVIYLPLLSVLEANDRHPGWSEEPADSAQPRFVVYDPGNLSAALQVVPQQTTEYKWLLEGVVKPDAMKNLSDVPFNGDISLAGLHYLLTLYAAHLAWDTDKANGDRERQRYLAEYNDRVAYEFGRLRTHKVQVRNNYLRSFRL